MCCLAVIGGRRPIWITCMMSCCCQRLGCFPDVLLLSEAMETDLDYLSDDVAEAIETDLDDLSDVLLLLKLSRLTWITCLIMLLKLSRPTWMTCLMCCCC